MPLWPADRAAPVPSEKAAPARSQCGSLGGVTPEANRSVDAVFDGLIGPRIKAAGAAWPRRGTLLFVVGTSAWTVRLGHGEPPVERGAHGEADLVLSLSERALAGLLEGSLDLDAALAAKTVGYRGDLRLLESLGRLLAGPGRAHDVRGGA